MTPRPWNAILALSLAVAAAVAAGCGGGDSNKRTPPIAIDVRNGTWRVFEVITESGTDTSCFSDSVATADTLIVTTVVDTTTLCELSPWGDPNSADLDCENNVSGSDVLISCQVKYPLDVCDRVFEVTASGTVTQTSWDLQLKFLSTLIGPVPPCDFFDDYGDTCITEIHSVGTWLSAAGDTICGNSVLTGTDLVRSILTRTRAEARR